MFQDSVFYYLGPGIYITGMVKTIISFSIKKDLLPGDDKQHIDNKLHAEEKREASKLTDGWKGN